MIGNDHEVPARETRIDGARGIGQYQRFRPKPADDARAKCDFRHRVAFVVMYAAFENHDRPVSNFSKNNLAAMSDNFRHREMGNGNVMNALRAR